jgi:hypothetical protein
MFEENFSFWSSWRERNEISNLQYPGIYAILYSDELLSGNRFSWSKKIIYIGMTNSRGGLRSRLRQFDKTLQGEIKHGGADRVLYRHQVYNQLASLLYLSVLSVPCDIKSGKPNDLRIMGEVARLEYFCFAEYAERFGRLPEFNDKKRSPKYSLSTKRQST